jgi:serine/threonine-protein kinase HipA
VMGKRSALTTSDFVNFAEDFVEDPEKKILQVFDAVGKFQSLCDKFGIDRAISDKIRQVLDGLVTDDLNLLHAKKQ